MFVGSHDTYLIIPFINLGMAWKTQYLITSNLFTKATQPAEIVEAFENCPPIPPLDELDVFRADGQSSMKVCIWFAWFA